MMPTAAFRRSRLAILSLVLASCVSILTAADRTFVTSPTLATEAATLVQLFKNAHFNRANVHLSDYGEVIPDYMAVWDGQHMFFLESDKNAFMKKYNGATVYEQVSQGDIDAAYEIYNLYSDRVEARINWIFNELKKPMNLDENETFARDRSKSEWPATAADSDTLWRLRLKYEIIEELLASKAKPAVTPNLKPKDGEAAPTGTMTIRGIPEAGNSASGAVDNAASPEQAKDKAEVSAKPVVTADPVTAATEVVRKRYERLLKNMGDIEGGDLAEAYLTSIAALYDPHSNYFSAADFEEFGIQMKLQLVGIGAVLQLKDDFCTIEELVPGGPADLGHQLKPNDKIVAVAQGSGEPVEIIGMKLRKIVDQIRGAKGTVVRLIVQPANATDSSVR